MSLEQAIEEDSFEEDSLLGEKYEAAASGQIEAEKGDHLKLVKTEEKVESGVKSPLFNQILRTATAIDAKEYHGSKEYSPVEGIAILSNN